MDVRQIKDPAFLQGMNEQELQKLCGELREFIIESVSHTGGHLSSNLGLVELTVALHRVFHTPQDKIIFDVGHQCYTHKLLTGRAAEFDTLRCPDGLSGFQCMTCVILPQMFRAVLPSYVGFFISLFKDTSIVTMVGLIDLTYAGVMVSQRYPGQMFECYALMAVIFFIICFALSKASKRIEEKLARKYGILGC